MFSRVLTQKRGGYRLDGIWRCLVDAINQMLSRWIEFENLDILLSCRLVLARISLELIKETSLQVTGCNKGNKEALKRYRIFSKDSFADLAIRKANSIGGNRLAGVLQILNFKMVRSACLNQVTFGELHIKKMGKSVHQIH